MKIAFVSTYDFAIPGGVKNHICYLAQALSCQGHTAVILAPSSQPKITNSIQNFIQVARFPYATKTGPVPPHLLLNPLSMLGLQKILNKLAFDLVHIHEPLIPLLCLSVLLHKKTPLFATFHTYYENGQPLYRIFRPILNKWLQRLHGRITVSKSARAYIANYFPYEYKIIPNGVDIEKFSNPVSSSILTKLAPGYFNLLFVGHAQFKRKGLLYMLESYRILKKKYPQLRLIIAGAKWAGAGQPAELNNIDLPDIHYLGTVDEMELIALYQTVDIFCAPSIKNESFGMVLIEAMAAGTPIVTTNINGYMEVVQDGYNALVVPAKNSHAFAQAIQQLIENPALRQSLVNHGKSSVKHYAWHKIAKAVINYYLEKLPH